METRRNRIKGVVLTEVIVAVLILSIFATGLLAAFFMQNKLLHTVGHKAHAMNYAISAAEKIFTVVKKAQGSYYYDYYPGMIPELTTGTHTIETDPHICELPESYFKNKLNGKLEYTVETLKLDENISTSKATITVTWKEEDSQETTGEESLVIAPVFGYFYYFEEY